MRLNETLHIRLDLSKTRHELSHAALRVEQLQARHLPLLDSAVRNTEENKIVSAKVFGPVKMV
ncbi:hypothetical protein [Streptomyces sp. NEAU-S7GS2]|uniref:hypothetical protein n=1 Tax=Streptomyces sp. NEAU-S7GS2 TaxID=2202000 RepID=UPI001EF5C4EC|nr:hypothetical protein [Streptomyces sp. NEAU-S7GS2]